MNNLAFLVGCEEYNQDNLENLSGVNNDVAVIRNALINYCDCTHEHVYTVTSQLDSACEPTGTKMIDFIIQKADEYGNKSINNLFFYFSGHGYLSAQNRVCLVLKDSMISPIIVGTVEVETIIVALKQFPSVNHIILFLDICQSELMTKGVIGDQIIPSDYFPKGVVIFFSCFPRNASFMIPPNLQGKYGRGSVFTKCLVEALQPKNKCYSVKDISAFLKKEVTNLSSQLGCEQKPYTQAEELSLDDVIISNHFIETEHVLNDEEKNMIEVFAGQLVDDGNALSYSNLGATTEKKMADFYESFSQFISINVRTDFNKLTLNNNKFIKELRTFKKNGRTLLYYMSSNTIPLRITDLEAAMTTFLNNISIYNNSFHKYMERLRVCNVVYSNYIKEFDIYILSIEFALKMPPKTGAEVLENRLSSIKKHRKTYEELGSSILKFRDILNVLEIQMHDLIDMCTPLISRLKFTVATQGDLSDVILIISDIIYTMNLINDIVS